MAGGEALKTVEFQPVAGADATPRPHLSVVRSLHLDRTRKRSGHYVRSRKTESERRESGFAVEVSDAVLP